jgi:hypothetical protein
VAQEDLRMGTEALFDDLQRLRETEALARLLAHYAALGAADREAWQDRLMHLDGVEPRQLVPLHGELIAYGWVEQNTGSNAVWKAGAVAACYRVTAAGVRALRQARDGELDEDDRSGGAAEEEAARPKARRARRKVKAGQPASAATP